MQNRLISPPSQEKQLSCLDAQRGVALSEYGFVIHPPTHEADARSRMVTTCTMSLSKQEFTLILHAASEGDEAAKKQLWILMYDELRQIAHGQLLSERSDHTLSTTALVHEAYLRLVDQDKIKVRDRVHFQSVAARAMRQILVDYARRHKAQKRGGGRADVAFDEAVHKADERADDLLALDEALGQLERLSERLSKVVECRYFGGLTMSETAAILGLSVRTVERDWVKARGWLLQHMHGASNGGQALT